MKQNKFIRQEVIRLSHKYSVRQISRIVRLSKSTVDRIIQQYRERRLKLEGRDD